MNKLLKILNLVVLLFVFSSPVLAKPINDAIIAIVDNEVITLKDLKDYISGIYRQLKIEHKSQKEIEEIIASYEQRGVQQLIEDKLILAAANKKGIEIRGDALDKRIREIKSRYPSEDDFLKEINAQGVTVTDIKNKITNQMKSKYEVDLEVRDKIFVNPEDVTKYYNNHINEFASKVKYNLDSIYIAFNQNRLGAMQRISEARRKLMDGADMETIAKEYSQAPSVGAIEEGQMVPTIEKEIFALKEGEISQPLAVDAGVYLFKVKSISKANQQSLEEVKDSIYNKLFNQQFQEKFEAWIKKLREKAYVEIRG